MKTSPSSLAREAACPGSTLLPQSDTSSPPALRGTALHAYLCSVAKGIGKDIALLMIPEEWRDAASSIDLEQLPAINPETGVPEIAIAWNVMTGETRELARGGNLSRDEIRAMARDGEMVGILDWLALTDSAVVVHDWKSGYSAVDRAEVNWQLAAGAVMASKLLGRDRAHVAITRLLSNGDAFHDVATLDSMDLDAAESKIRAHVRGLLEHEETFRQNGVLPKLIEGSHCRYCPAFKFCPAKVALAKSILSEDGRAPSMIAALPVPMSNEDAIALWPRLQLAADLVKKLQGTIREIAQREPLTLANGNILAEVEKTTSKVIPERLKAYVDPSFFEKVVKRTESVTKEAIEDALKASKAPSEKITHVKKAFYEELEKQGGLKTSAYRAVEEVSPKSRKLAAVNQ